MAKAPELLSQPPTIEPVDVLAAKLSLATDGVIASARAERAARNAESPDLRTQSSRWPKRSSQGSREVRQRGNHTRRWETKFFRRLSDAALNPERGEAR